MDYPVERDEFADVWKGRYHSQDVAVRVLSVNPRSRLDRIASVGHWCPFTSHVCSQLCLLEILHRSYHMEGPPSSKCHATFGGDND